ncbi:MAG: hypothetical protein WAU15_06055 [Nitrosomonas sp.]
MFKSIGIVTGFKDSQRCCFVVHIKAVHAASKGEYGWLRVWWELRANRVWTQR